MVSKEGFKKLDLIDQLRIVICDSIATHEGTLTDYQKGCKDALIDVIETIETLEKHKQDEKDI